MICAMAKINHDLRNTLVTAVLTSDALATVDNPEVKRVMPRLFTAIDKAVHLCSDTLNYVADGIPKLQRKKFPLTSLVDKVGLLLTSPETDDMVAEELQQNTEAKFEWCNEVNPTMEIEADRRQLFRAIQNLGHNVRLAGAGWIRVYAHSSPEKISIEIADNGPGSPEQAKVRLFQPFAGSVRKGGTGLGLVIIRDILRAHGGDVALVRSDKMARCLV
jgi:signal transduction histidine kinase